jgi:hypothetical protein
VWGGRGTLFNQIDTHTSTSTGGAPTQQHIPTDIGFGFAEEMEDEDLERRTERTFSVDSQRSEISRFSLDGVRLTSLRFYLTDFSCHPDYGNVT